MNIINVKIKAKPEGSYPIIVAEGILNNAYEHIKKYTKAEKFLIVTNTLVYELYGSSVKIPNAGFCILPDGEKYKTMEYLNVILDKAFEMRLERSSAMIALGGGVTGDMTGFAAAVYERGIDYIQIPTTLLAQVDSSIGGKTAVNHVKGKNMIGAFYQPKCVLSDVNTLKTLDERQYKTGLSEVIKYAFIEKTCGAAQNYNLIEFLNEYREKIQNKDPETLIKLISACCALKSAVVNKDEKEKGLRAILNFGHTYAHAIENITNYEKYTHGEAVSIGMKLIFDLAFRLGKISEEYKNKSVSLLKSYGLLLDLDFKPDKEKFYNAMLSDKKVSKGMPVFIMPSAPAEAEIMSGIDKKAAVNVL